MKWLYQWLHVLVETQLIYGICALALMAESVWLLSLFIHEMGFSVFLFLSTLLYYQYPALSSQSKYLGPFRSRWWVKRLQVASMLRILLVITWILMLFTLVYRWHISLATMNFVWWLGLFLFPLLGAFYYRHAFLPFSFSLRQWPWLKPFIIGFVWAGMTVVYPVLFAILKQPNLMVPFVEWKGMFLSNFLFISILAILFDIKDQAEDKKAHFVSLLTKLGLPTLLLGLALPLALLSAGWSLLQAFQMGFGFWSSTLFVFPHLLLVWAVLSCKKPQAPLFYFLFIDGLMFLKAFCGMAAWYLNRLV